MKFLLICTVIIVASNTEASYNEGELNKIDDNLLHDSLIRAKRLVDNAYTETRKSLKLRVKRKAARPADIIAHVRQPVGQSRNAIRAADYMDVTLQLMAEKLKYIYGSSVNISDVLTPQQKEILYKLTGCVYQFLPKVCSESRYRTINGECNNRKNPTLGASDTGFRQILAPEYQDHVFLPKGWTENHTINGFPLPKARAVSNGIVHYNKSTPTGDAERSQMFMQFGQFLDHDISLAPDTPARSAFYEGVDCETSCAQAHPCFPLKIPENDPSRSQSDCIPLFRSAPVCDLVSPVRKQINIRTAFIDGSQIYGSYSSIATKLRNTTNNLGLMAVNQNYTDNGQSLLPFVEKNGEACTSSNPSAGISCFFAGDARVNEQLGLTAFHTLFIREHNRIAMILHDLNPLWSGEIIYQETRKIMGSIVQKIAFKDWMPLLLGSEMPHVLPTYTGYNESEDPRVANIMANAFRVGHTLVFPMVHRLGVGYLPHEIDPVLSFHQLFSATWRIVLAGGIDPFLRGMMVSPAKLNKQDQIVDDELRDRLFKLDNPTDLNPAETNIRRKREGERDPCPPGGNKPSFRDMSDDSAKQIVDEEVLEPPFNMLSSKGLDLPALNIQRSRDHGLPAYIAWRRFCGLSAPSNLDELAIVLNNTELATKFMDLYGTTKNIDLWPGGVSEPLVLGGRVGKLLACLIGFQFRSIRDGDRFYYENPSVHSEAQRRSIENVTMSHLICANTNITKVPINVFLGNQNHTNFAPCSSISAMDLSPWKVTPEPDKAEGQH